MLTIRLQRVGKKNQASFRIVLAEKYRAAKKQVVEILGHYNPRTKEFGLKDPERLKYWISEHVEFSPTAHNLLVTKGLLEGKKLKAWRPKVKPKEEAPKEQKPAAGAGATPEAKSEAKEEAKVQSEAPAATEIPAEAKSTEKAEMPDEAPKP